MPKYLVVVESPAKARTINKFLGSNYVVKASFGHVRDLPKSELGVDVENDFQPKYVTLKDSSKHISELKKSAGQVERILLASDPDREGEAIGWHIAQILEPLKKPVDRVVFNEITKKAIQEAVKHPRPIDENLVNAQQARRVLDRLLGYKISPFLQWAVQRGLSAGRVQSVAVRMVCDREDDIRRFIPEEYWTLDASFLTPRNDAFTARLFRMGGEKAVVPTREVVDRILSDLDGAAYKIANVERKEVQRKPSAPFITSTLQQEASRKLGFNPRRTMSLAQQLYEGIKLGPEGETGLITYMRTDSTRLSEEALDDVRGFIASNYEPAMLPERPNFYASKKGAQDAHEAIRPTAAARTPDAVKPYLDADQHKLYALIWMRFVSCQMSPAILDQMTIDVEAKKYIFRATGSVVKFPGFTKVYEEASDDAAGNGKEVFEDTEHLLPQVEVGENVKLRDELKAEQHFTKPPARYTEASLIRALEENGIGRPSTYAPTMNTIVERGYVEREKNRLKPTELGEKVNHIMVKHFPEIVDPGFTAQMEDDLDHVEEGRREWHALLKDFYKDFSTVLGTAQRNVVSTMLDSPDCPNCGAPMEVREGRFGMFICCQKYPECKTTARTQKNAVEATDEICEACGSPMVIRTGRFGKFMSCSTYPKCKTTHPVDEQGNKVARAPKDPPRETDEKCPKCNANLLIRKSRTGEEFYGCSKYPKCKFTRPMELGLKCPKPGCEGNLVSKLGKGRRFIGCDKYPECDFIVSGKLDKTTPCPKCGHAWTSVYKGRGKDPVRRCPVCAHEESMAEAEEQTVE
ncbi:MAG: type I DNA topoisomerase [FCB group bacterium]|jgi:DNA topoisomerase-1|nr:type I DNA topoisomerase [FCB group bacterium]